MTSGDLLAGELNHRAPVDKTSARATSDSRARANSRARRARSRRVCVALAAALLAGAAIARAQDPIVPSVAPPTVRTQHARRDRVEWDWPRFRLWEYAGT